MLGFLELCALGVVRFLRRSECHEVHLHFFSHFLFRFVFFLSTYSGGGSFRSFFHRKVALRVSAVAVKLVYTVGCTSVCVFSHKACLEKKIYRKIQIEGQYAAMIGPLP